MAGVSMVGVSIVWIDHNRFTPVTFDTDPSSVAHASPSSDPVGERSPVATADNTPTAIVPSGSTAATPSPKGDPVGLVIPSLGVNAPVEPILTGAGQVLQPPDDPSKVGWWLASSPPGADIGPTVLVGHVDSAAAGPGALYRLTDLEPGAQVIVRTAVDSEVAFAVADRTTYNKSDGLPPELFDLNGPAQLILITCGGEFDPDTASYEQNIVLRAEPVS